MSAPRASDHLARILRELPAPLLIALRDVPLPIWVVDRLGCIRWVNAAASERIGARLGAHFSRFVAADGVADARELFARKIHGRLDSTVQRITLNGTAGPVNAELTSVPIRDGDDVIGVITFIFAQEERGEARRRRRKPRLTPRQHQVLELLAHGRSTSEIAQALQISEDTVRNHIRHLLSEIGVRTRLEAVVVAFRNGWL
jgi:DNA-binding CsgD family transcriptional regulator